MSDGATRTADWIETTTGISAAQIKAVAARWPETFAVETVNLARVGEGFLQVKLRREQYEPVSQPVEPPPSLQPSLAELVDPSELRDLRWKPASPLMALSRNDPRITKSGYVRTRRPLVEI